MRVSSIVGAALVGISLAACQTTGAQTDQPVDSATRLATQSDIGAIAGKTLTLEPGKSYVISAEGKINGSWDGSPLVGTYEMKNGFFCRTLSQGPRGPSPEDCQVLTLDGNVLSGTRNRGEGASFKLTVS